MAFINLFVCVCVVGSTTVEVLVGSVAPNPVACQVFPPAVAASPVVGEAGSQCAGCGVSLGQD